MKKDVFLMIPCDLSNYKYDNESKKSEIGNFLISEVEKNNMSEFKSNFIKGIERSVIGEYKLSSSLMQDTEDSIVTLTRHPKTNNGMICIYIPLAKNEPVVIIQSLVSNLLNIKTENGEFTTLKEYLFNNKIMISGNSKALVFLNEEISQQEIIKILACESDPLGEIVGSKLVEMSKLDIAQYNTAKVYCGENVLLELQKNFLENIKDRIANEAIEVFFMELLLLQEAAITRICDRITKELEIEIENPIRKNNIQVLEELSCETSQAILFLDFDCFIYPTVRNAAEEIYKKFGIDKLIDKYYKYKNVLETLINIHDARVDEVDNNNLNILLLVLTLTQVVSVLADLFLSLFENRFGFVTALSFISSIGVCFMLLLIFNILRKRQLKNYKNKSYKKRLSNI